MGTRDRKRVLENFDKFYTHFQRPPLAPVYYPTAEEFADPIAYVARIRPEAEKYGIVKIVPPESFQPPFAIDKNSFEFTPRVQRLNEVEALCREKTTFLEKLKSYWELQGSTFKVPYLDGKIVDLFKAYLIIKAEGGFDAVCEKKKWQHVARLLGIKSQQGGSKLKEHFYRLIVPFDANIEEKHMADDESEDDKEDIKYEKKPASRMMAGGSANFSKKEKKKKKLVRDALAAVKCAKCHRGDSEGLLLLCEDCDTSIHTFCLTPPLKEVPKGDWRCPSCVAKEVRKMGMGFGFYDAHTTYNLDSFKQFADHFKREYFKMEPEEVPDDLVEKTFWRKVNDPNETVSVKYGADLITSKVGSGFVRRSDEHIRERQYANHPWNLNNLPVLRDSVLSHFDSGISGMMVPWVYVGMCFSTFCWHTEDHWTYSINYNHWGEAKVWYGISGDEATRFEETVRGLAPGLFKQQPDLLHHMTTAVNPHLLRNRGVSVYTLRQKAREFVITFPRAYHAGFNEGLNFAEAVNFAPIDWLRMGRLAMADYAQVGRGCVFSHDELVLKMVNACDRLTIAMSVAALGEMKEMSRRECAARANIVGKGVSRSVRVEFEKIADDHRVCRVCNTTLFMSALSCAHNRSTCLDHFDRICSKCPLDECILKYRYTLEELLPMIEQLRERTQAYEEWMEQVDTVLSDKQKPTMFAIENLMETARSRHFPVDGPLRKLTSIHRECQTTLSQGRLLLNGKVRVRTKTRNQRADTRFDMPGVHSLLAEMKKLPCEIHDVIPKIEELIEKIDAWDEEAKRAIDEGADRQILLGLFQKGEQFDIRHNTLSLLEKHIEQSDWMTSAHAICEWKPTHGMEHAEDFLTRSRWSIKDMHKLIAEGCRVGLTDTQKMARLKEMRDEAIAHDEQASSFLDGDKKHVEGLKELWSRAKYSDWCTGYGLDKLRSEVEMVEDVSSYERGLDITLTDLCTVIDICRRSSILCDAPLIHRKEEQLRQMQAFSRSLCAIFLNKTSYYQLTQILSIREDLIELVEGTRSPLSVVHAKLESVWLPLERFESREEVRSHQSRLDQQLPALMRRLRDRNDKRSASQTCSCLSDRAGVHLVCALCSSKTHLVCAWWSPFLAFLPPGAYLCVRCLKGRRPLIDDVFAITATTPTNFLEVELTMFMAKRSKRLFGEAVEAFKRGDDEDKCRSLMYEVLSCECVDGDALRVLSPQFSSLLEPLLTQQLEAWKALRERPAPARCPLHLYTVPGKRHKSSLGVAKKKTRVTDEAADEPCDHDQCLRPYSDSLMWVHCEGPCGRWLHVICIGEDIDEDASFHCSRCL